MLVDIVIVIAIVVSVSSVLGTARNRVDPGLGLLDLFFGSVIRHRLCLTRATIADRCTYRQLAPGSTLCMFRHTSPHTHSHPLLPCQHSFSGTHQGLVFTCWTCFPGPCTRSPTAYHRPQSVKYCRASSLPVFRPLPLAAFLFPLSQSAIRKFPTWIPQLPCFLSITTLHWRHEQR